MVLARRSSCCLMLAIKSRAGLWHTTSDAKRPCFHFKMKPPLMPRTVLRKMLTIRENKVPTRPTRRSKPPSEKCRPGCQIWPGLLTEDKSGGGVCSSKPTRHLRKGGLGKGLEWWPSWEVVFRKFSIDYETALRSRMLEKTVC